MLKPVLGGANPRESVVAVVVVVVAATCPVVCAGMLKPVLRPVLKPVLNAVSPELTRRYGTDGNCV